MKLANKSAFLITTFFFPLFFNADLFAKERKIIQHQTNSREFADVIEEILPTVVNISTSQEIITSPTESNEKNNSSDDDFRSYFENQIYGQSGQRKKSPSIGSGFIISKDGFIVTNGHVVEESNEIEVNLNDGAKYKAKVVGIDRRTDLALLKINSEKELKPVKFGDSTKSRIGDWVIVVGNPYGFGGSVSLGIISARGRDVNNIQSEGFIQTDAAINKGNSGGPMFNRNGEVIGINTAIFSSSGASVGIGFATPSSSAQEIIKQLKEQGEVVRGWIGVSVQDISEEMSRSMDLENNKGVFVIDTTNNGPAQKTGILPSDIIVKFGNQEVLNMKSLSKIVAAASVGKMTKVTILRNKKVKILDIKVEKMRNE